jgi:hypothetical protein
MIKYIFKDFDSDGAYTFFSYKLSNFGCVDIIILFTNEISEISIEFDIFEPPIITYNKLTENVKINI